MKKLLKILLYGIAIVALISALVILKDPFDQLRFDWSHEHIERKIVKNYYAHTEEFNKLLEFVTQLPDSSTTYSIRKEKFAFAYSLQKSVFPFFQEELKWVARPNTPTTQLDTLTFLLNAIDCEGILIETNGDIRLLYAGYFMLYHYEYFYTKYRSQEVDDERRLDDDLSFRIYDANIFCGLHILEK